MEPDITSLMMSYRTWPDVLDPQLSQSTPRDRAR